jgi:nucleoside phosphorylase
MESESWQLLRYAFDSAAWQDVLGKKAVYITGTLAGMRSEEEYQTDLVILTALKEIELDAVLSLPCEWKSLRRNQDDTYYYEGRIETEGGPLNVVCCAAIEMGMAATACLATKVIYNFSPRYLAMAGITAGISGNFGDVIFADQSWDYGAGKVINSPGAESAFKPGPNYIAVDAELKEKVQHFKQSQGAILHQIESRWQGNAPTSRLSLHVGPVASGAAVVESQEIIDAIRTHNRKLIGVEMEVYGSFLACRTAKSPRPKCFAAKSICDFGAPPKTDEYQKYAAFTSAQFVYEFAKLYLR